MTSISPLSHIKATVIQDSVAAGIRITTLELEYPRFIHAELLTHRQFSRNSASSRAIPVDKMLDHIKQHPAIPVYWGKNMPGMQSKEELEGTHLAQAKLAWSNAVESAVFHSKEMLDAGLHKQYANRNTEFAQTTKTVVTATEWDNWFWLRDHEDAQNEIHELARCMREAMTQSAPLAILASEWHVPYVDREFDADDDYHIHYFVGGEEVSLDEARMVSASCCAQVSYRKTDDSLDKAKMVFSRLIDSEPVHASPVEHQATPMICTATHLGDHRVWEAGVTHLDRRGRYWSGNFRGWTQFRQLIPNNSK